MMEPHKIHLALLFALINAGHVLSHSVKIHPKRATGIVGGEVQINCEVEFGPNYEMSWDFNNEFVYIMARGVESYPQGTSKYSVQKTGMNFTLTLRDLNLEDGGGYMCTSFTSEATVLLVVLDTPSITLNPPALIEGETTKVTCEARFGGPSEDLILPGHFPNLTMYSSQNEMFTAKPTYDVKKRYSLNMTENLKVHTSMNNTQIICEVGTAEPSVKHSSAAPLIVYADPSKSENGERNEDAKDSSGVTIAVVTIIIIIILAIIVAVAFIFRSKILKPYHQIYGRSRTNENDVTTSQGNDDSGAPNQSVKVNLKEQQSDVTEPLLSVGEMAPEQEVNLQEQKSDVTEPLLPVEKLEATKKETLESIQLLKSVNNKEGLDQHGKKILRVLQDDRKSILEKEPNILIGLIQKADKLIDSEYYEDIIKVVPHGGEDCPLKCLLKLMKEEKSLKKLLKAENKVLSVIQRITKYGDVQYRSECLKFLISDRKFCSGTCYKFEFSNELLSTLKNLLDEGADPTWIPQGFLTEKRELQSTAQMTFLWRIFFILWENNKLYESLWQVLPLMLSKKCTNTEGLRGTILHELVEPHWDYIATNRERMPPNFFNQFKIFLRAILKHDETLIVKQDSFGCTPLQVFLYSIKLDESIFSDVREIIKLLQSPEVLKNQDRNGQIALHYLAKAFPLFQGIVTRSKMEPYLDLVKSFASQSSVCIQDELGQTALHLLVCNQKNSELFLDFVKIFETAANITDTEGETALQILLKQYPLKVSESEVTSFLDTVKFLNTHTYTQFQDREGTAFLHTIANQFEKKMPLHILNIYCQLFQIIASKSNVSYQDNGGQTALHILARKFPSEISEESREVYQNVMKHLATYEILEKTDGKGLTALHLLAYSFKLEFPDYVMETFLQVIKYLAVPKIICLKDPNGQTAMQIISKAYGKKVPKEHKKRFKEITKIFETKKQMK